MALINIPYKEQIDDLNGHLSNIATNIGNTSNIGDLTTLETTDKSSLVSAVNEIKRSSLATQEGHSGEFLTTNGTKTSWASLVGLPDQDGADGKYLMSSNGTAVWKFIESSDDTSDNLVTSPLLTSAVSPNLTSATYSSEEESTSELPDQEGADGKYLKSNGTSAYWGDSDIPENKESYSGKYLMSTGTSLKWNNVLPSSDETSEKFLMTSSGTLSWSLVPSELPEQSENSGKFLRTVNNSLEWQYVPASLPDQDGHSGEFLRTVNGTAFWVEIPNVLPSQSSDTSGLFLKSENSSASWVSLPSELPNQEGQSGKYLKSVDGSVSWEDTPQELPFYISGDSGKSLTVSGTSLEWSYILPDQEENSGKILRTVNNSLLWDDFSNLLPEQSENSGKFLMTSSGTLSWSSIPSEIPDKTDNSGKYLKNNSGTLEWSEIDNTLPDQEGYSGKYLKTINGIATWEEVPQELPDTDGADNKFLKCSSGNPVWSSIFPSISGTSGKYLKNTNGTLSWSPKNEHGNIQESTINADSGTCFEDEPLEDKEYIFSCESSVCFFTLVLKNAGLHEITWPSNCYWPSGIKPNLSSDGTDIINFMTPDSGSSWYGSVFSLNAK